MKNQARALGCLAGFLVIFVVLYLTGGFQITWGGPKLSLPTPNPKMALMLSAAEVAGFEPGPNDPLIEAGGQVVVPSSEQRVFDDRANTLHIEDDLQFYGSGAAASADYASFLDATRAVVTSIASYSSPSIGSQSEEYVGTDNSGHSTVAVDFQEGTVLGVIFVSVFTGNADAAYAEAVAGAQDQKILKGSTSPSR